MYTLEADIKAESVMAVLYAAKKYDVQPLVDRCRLFLKEGLDVENVCEILEQAVTFSEEILVDECIAFSKKNAAKVFNTDGLLGVSQPVLRIVAEKGFVEIDPLQCYEISKKWALKHFKVDKVEDLDPEKVRNVLGDVLNRIQFSDMQLDTFIDNVVSENILTDSTKCSIIMTINEKLKSVKEITINRFKEITGTWTYNGGRQDGISFTVSAPALLTGVILYLPNVDGETSGPLEILQGDEVVLTQNLTLKYQYGTQYRNEPLSTKIHLQLGKVYSVRLRIQGKTTYRGQTAISKPCDQFITIEFMDLQHGKSNNSTRLEQGQIPGLTIQVPDK